MRAIPLGVIACCAPPLRCIDGPPDCRRMGWAEAEPLCLKRGPDALQGSNPAVRAVLKGRDGLRGNTAIRKQRGHRRREIAHAPAPGSPRGSQLFPCQHSAPGWRWRQHLKHGLRGHERAGLRLLAVGQLTTYPDRVSLNLYRVQYRRTLLTYTAIRSTLDMGWKSDRQALRTLPLGLTATGSGMEAPESGCEE